MLLWGIFPTATALHADTPISSYASIWYVFGRNERRLPTDRLCNYNQPINWPTAGLVTPDRFIGGYHDCLHRCWKGGHQLVLGFHIQVGVTVENLGDELVTNVSG